LPKAKDLRPVIEKLVTLSRRGVKDLHARRQARPDQGCDQVTKLFDVIGPRYAGRPRLYPRAEGRLRHGDNAPMAIIESSTVTKSAKGLDRVRWKCRKTPRPDFVKL